MGTGVAQEFLHLDNLNLDSAINFSQLKGK